MVILFIVGCILLFGSALYAACDSNDNENNDNENYKYLF